MVAVPALFPHGPGSPSPFVLIPGRWICRAELQQQLCAVGCWRGTSKPHNQGCGVVWRREGAVWHQAPSWPQLRWEQEEIV